MKQIRLEQVESQNMLHQFKKNRNISQTTIVSLLFLFLILLFISIYKNSIYLFPGGDGKYAIQIIRDQYLWSDNYLGFSNNFYQGLGDLYFPLNTTIDIVSILVNYLISYSNENLALYKSTFYFGFYIELLISTYVYSRVFGFSSLISICSGALSGLIMLPINGMPVAYLLFMISPFLITLVSGSMLFCSCYLSIDPANNIIKNVILFFLSFIIISYITLVNPVGLLVVIPIYLISLIFDLILGLKNKKNILIRFICGALLIFIWAAIFLKYIFAILIYTQTFFWKNEFSDYLSNIHLIDLSSWYWPHTFLFKPFIVLSFSGIMVALIREKGKLLHYTTSLTSIVVILYFFAYISLKFQLWRGIAPVYFESILIPIFSIYVCYFIFWFYDFSMSNFKKFFHPFLSEVYSEACSFFITSCLLVISLCSIYKYSYYPIDPGDFGPELMSSTPITNYLQEKTSIYPGSQYKGRVASFFLANDPGPIEWNDIIKINESHVSKKGNDYYWSGLWSFNIPTLWEYSPIMSPIYYKVATFLWGFEFDKQTRNVVVIRNPKLNTLALFGVKYVITDKKLVDPYKLILEENVSGDEKIYLYELPDPNLGNYAPKSILFQKSLAESLSIMKKADFDPRYLSIIHEKQNSIELQHLDELIYSEVRMFRDGIQIKAKSAGRSLLVLPFEYSNCYYINNKIKDHAKSRILRVNILQTGLLFEDEINIQLKYFTGPFKNPDCRMEDAHDLQNLLEIRK